MIRHGPRTPVSTYPKDPYINETYAPYGWGQLTNAAKVELYKIGKQLGKRYQALLEPYYQPDMILAQASKSPRTVMSLQMVLAGLLPPDNTPMEWNTNLNWQPIPIYTEPVETDFRLRQKVHCPRFEEAVWEVMQKPEVLDFHQEYSELLMNLTELTGLDVTYAHDVTNIFISLQTQQAYGLKLPEWSKDYFPDKMQPLAEKSYSYDAYTTELRKLKGGFFLDALLDELQAKVAGKIKPGRKLYIDCAHDWTIANVLSALDIWQTQMPRFSALVAFELHRRADNYFVEIHFQNDPNEEPKLLQVPGCRKQCPLKKLIELTAHVLPDAPYQQLCIARGLKNITRISYN
ncbi:hypothetical protein KR222_007847 [Zaprionus bogoriensis]|nr:hypothetical protein KR222_007847 [Zaprionus bogoriensis]